MVGFGLTALLSDYADTAICPFLGLGLVGIALIIAGQGMPARTKAGADAAAKWQATPAELPAAGAVAIFAMTYLVMAIGKLPGFHLDRAGAALLGASLMTAIGLLSLDDVYRAIDIDTIALLLGVMIVVANVRLSGFFRVLTNWIVTHARHPLLLLSASEKVYRQIDWPLLLMFMGLFVVVAGFEKAALTPDLTRAIAGLHLDRLPMLSLVTAVLSNLVSNVPAVLVLKPFVASLDDPQRAWLTVAMSSTLAGLIVDAKSG